MNSNTFIYKSGTPVSTIVENNYRGRSIPASPDNVVAPRDLERRNRIRQRNKEAAQRVRDRRTERIRNFEQKIKELENEKQLLFEDNKMMRCALMKRTEREKTANVSHGFTMQRQVSNTDVPIDEPSLDPMVTDFSSCTSTSTSGAIEIYANGEGKSAFLVNSKSAFVLTPISHHIQLVTIATPQSPCSIHDLNNILNSL